MKFFIATKNQHKLEELSRIILPMGFEVISEKDLENKIPDVEETGTTFEENALLKARAGLKATGFPSVADDSGICVDALGGAPGIFSARYSGVDENTDTANNVKLLKELENVPYECRGAHYVSVIACVFPGGSEFTVRGECYGKIGFQSCGSGGFGYDPLFISEIGCFGLATAEEKDAVSHRGKSLKLFKEKLKDYI